MSLLGVDEIREFVGISQEEHRGVVSNQIPVAFFGVELHGKAPHITLGIGSPELAGHGGEANDEIGLLSYLGKDLGPRVLRDIVGDGERAISTPALRVDCALRDALAILVGELLD